MVPPGKIMCIQYTLYSYLTVKYVFAIFISLFRMRRYHKESTFPFYLRIVSVKTVVLPLVLCSCGDSRLHT